MVGNGFIKHHNVHNGSDYHYHFIIKELKDSFLMFSRKRKEVYNVFRSSTSRTCKWYDMQMVTYKIKLINSVRFMASPL